ncbi:hypothetical protein [Flavobacterium sp. LB1P62]|uniref:hypothetical protein n=1 Tax=Flavobacterium sp. LB1P62 TaxID=3401715 RepID=UPI003AAC7854
MKDDLKCLYCGEKANNREHVPSKGLLEKPYPNNLITIPACQICNNSFSLDEEYFLNVLATLSESGPLVTRTESGGKIYKSRERNSTLYKRLLNSLVQEEDGRTYFKPEIDRLKRVIEKYAFGIYYNKYEKHAPLNLFKCVGFYPFQAEETRPSEIVLLTHSEKFKLKKWIHIQENVFSYIVVRDWRRNNKLTMIFHVHNTAWCVIQIPYPTSNKWNKRNIEGQFKIFD